MGDQNILTGVLGLSAVLFLVGVFLSAKNWKWFHITMLVLNFLAAPVLMFFIAATIKTRTYWQQQAQANSQSIGKAAIEGQMLRTGIAIDEKGQLIDKREDSIAALRQQIYRLMSARGRVWRDCQFVSSATGKDGEASLTFKVVTRTKPLEPGIAAPAPIAPPAADPAAPMPDPAAPMPMAPAAPVTAQAVPIYPKTNDKGAKWFLFRESPDAGPGLPGEFYGAFGVDEVLEQPLEVNVVLHPVPPFIAMPNWDWGNPASVQAGMDALKKEGARFTLYELMPADGSTYVAHLDDQHASLSVDASPFIGLDEGKLLEIFGRAFGPSVIGQPYTLAIAKEAAAADDLRAVLATGTPEAPAAEADVAAKRGDLDKARLATLQLIETNKDKILPLIKNHLADGKKLASDEATLLEIFGRAYGPELIGETFTAALDAEAEAAKQLNLAIESAKSGMPIVPDPTATPDPAADPAAAPAADKPAASGDADEVVAQKRAALEKARAAVMKLIEENKDKFVESSGAAPTEPAPAQPMDDPATPADDPAKPAAAPTQTVYKPFIEDYLKLGRPPFYEPGQPITKEQLTKGQIPPGQQWVRVKFLKNQSIEVETPLKELPSRDYAMDQNTRYFDEQGLAIAPLLRRVLPIIQDDDTYKYEAHQTKILFNEGDKLVVDGDTAQRWKEEGVAAPLDYYYRRQPYDYDYEMQNLYLQIARTIQKSNQMTIDINKITGTGPDDMKADGAIPSANAQIATLTKVKEAVEFDKMHFDQELAIVTALKAQIAEQQKQLQASVLQLYKSNIEMRQKLVAFQEEVLKKFGGQVTAK